MLIGVLGLAAYGYYKNTAGMVDNLTARLSSFKLNKKAWQDSGFFTLFFDVVLTVNNPSDGTALLKSATINIAVNGRPLGKVSTTTPVNIYPNSSSKLNLLFRVPALSLFGSVDTAIKAITLKQPVSVQVQGEADLTAGTLKINESVKIAWQ